jgi:hypothetical protein
LTLVNEKNKNEANPRDIKLVLSGGNAAIDVAFDALNRGYQVKWIVGRGGPNFLPGFPNYAAYLPYLRSLNTKQFKAAGIKNLQDKEQKEKEARDNIPALYTNQEENIFKDVTKFKDAAFEKIYFGRSGAVTVTAAGVKVTVDGEGEPVAGDIMVFAQGQGTENFKLFDKFLADLVPEKDVNRRFTDTGNATIGLRSRDNTLKIVGATAYRMAREVQTAVANVEEMKSVDDLRVAFKKFLKDFKPEAHLDLSVLKQVWRQTTDLLRAYAPWSQVTKPKSEEQTKAFKDARAKYDEYDKELANADLTPDQRNGLEEFREALRNAMEIAQRLIVPTPAQELMKPVTGSLPGNVLINDQLTPSRSQIVVSTNFLPYDIAQKANFVTDDRTALAVHISAHYGALADELASTDKDTTKRAGEAFDNLVNGIITSRKDGFPTRREVVAVPPHGQEFQQLWEERLTKLNEEAKARKKQTKAVK